MAKVLNKAYLSLRKRIHQIKREKFYIKRVRGKKYLLDMDNLVDRHLDAYGYWEKDRLNYFTKELMALEPEMFLDVGSHWGYYAIEFALNKNFPDLEVVAFEPNKMNLHQLYGNLFLNGINNIKVCGFGLSDVEEAVRFEIKKHNRGAAKVSEDGEVVVDLKRLDDVVDARGKRIAIKIDIEGHEFRAISGMKKLLANNTVVLQIECFDIKAKEKLAEALGGEFKYLCSIENDHYYSNN